MKQLLFSPAGRLNRASFWKATILIIIADLVAGVLCKILGGAIPNQATEDGAYNVTGVAALPFNVIVFAFGVFSVWAGLCIAIKRYHDRDKSGFWLLIQVVPLIGAIWYFVETGFLAGTPGPNRFGPDPLLRTGTAYGAAA
ncbi:DUF805 domain-containing protein [Beijerinckia sp. L45]|uniref:DUF805 domain-containing protein n=1 Tax=Beijerinckia sp. L45 TaxID=1641855 RepID=UPI00131C7CA4|nr:DUF805 domain-containing protein [Beijerinckia sp. L45]